MEDLRTLQRIRKRQARVSYVFILIGALLFGSAWGIRAWLLGLGLILYGTTWDQIADLKLELVERLGALKTAKSS
jgi:hypothetical protein